MWEERLRYEAQFKEAHVVKPSVPVCAKPLLGRGSGGSEGRPFTCTSLARSAVEVMARSPAAPSASELSWRTVSADSLSGDLGPAGGDAPMSCRTAFLLFHMDACAEREQVPARHIQSH